jgi:small-conductance mechanosensitive channel
MLLAECSPGLLREPVPFVLRRSLDDYAVTYELNGYCREHAEMHRLWPELRRSVLNTFNEYS